jgi:O-antigen ligase
MLLPSPITLPPLDDPGERLRHQAPPPSKALIASDRRLSVRRWIEQFALGRRIGVATGCWLTLYCLADFLLRPRQVDTPTTFVAYREASGPLAVALTAVLALGAAPMVLGAALGGLDFRRSKHLFIVVLLICLSVALSYLGAVDQGGLIHLVLLYIVLGYIVVGVSAKIDREEFLKGLALGVVVSQTAMMAAVLINHDVLWGRLYGHNSPNYWGMSAQATIIACVAVKNRPLKVLAIAISIVTMVWSQSRGSMIATGAGLFAVLITLSLSRRLSFWIWVFAPALGLILGLLGFTFISDKLFLMSDPGRGLDSGFSGRVTVWSEALDLFGAHPVFGVGYREGENYLTTEVSAHNAYLATLADIGLFGTATYLILTFGGLYLAAKRALRIGSFASLFPVAYLSAYAVNGVFERNGLNTGNFYSMAALVLSAWSWQADTSAPRLPPTRPAAVVKRYRFASTVR